MPSLSWFGSMFQCFRCLFQMTFPDDCFGSLFQMTINCCDIHFTYILLHMANLLNRWLFRMRVSDDYSGLLFWLTISDAYFRWLFRMTISDAYFSWLFQMTGLDYRSRWTFRMLVRNSTADSYFTDQFVFPHSIPISTNHSTDWSHDWFVLERRLPTAELWPRSSLIFLTEHLRWLLLSKMWLSLQFAVSRESSYVEDFLLLLFQQKKGNILIVFKYLLFSQA